MVWHSLLDGLDRSAVLGGGRVAVRVLCAPHLWRGTCAHAPQCPSLDSAPRPEGVSIAMYNVYTV